MFTQEESIEVPSKLVRKNTYTLRVRGNSMIDANILDGDVVATTNLKSQKMAKELSFELTKKN